MDFLNLHICDKYYILKIVTSKLAVISEQAHTQPLETTKCRLSLARSCIGTPKPRSLDPPLGEQITATSSSSVTEVPSTSSIDSERSTTSRALAFRPRIPMEYSSPKLPKSHLTQIQRVKQGTCSRTFASSTMETSDHSGSRIQRKSVLTPTSRRSIPVIRNKHKLKRS